ncbi:MAG: hypothetical protein HQ536_01815 [Parcubacteria group bacterium]|nr:hypothetical protein [Parcubacteria group bacterium]
MISVKDIILKSWKVYETNFKTILKITVWGFLAATLASIGMFLIDLLLFTLSPLVQNILSVVVGLPQVIVSLWVSIVLIDFLDKNLTKKGVNLSESISKGFRVFVPVILLSIVVGLIQFAGFLLLIIPGIIFTIWFVFAIYEMVLGGKDIKESLRSSKELSKNRWWAVAWRYFAPAVFWGVTGWFATSIVVFSTQKLIEITNITLDIISKDILNFVLATAQNAFYFFFVPLTIASALILYRELKKG